MGIRIKNNKNKMFIRITSTILSLVMLLSTIPIQPAYAADSGIVGDGGGNSGYEGGGAYRTDWTLARQGIRVSIVDPEGNNVLTGSGIDYSSVDILFSPPPSNLQAAGSFTGNKFEDRYSGSKVYTMGVGAFNTAMNWSIKGNEQLSHLELLPEFTSSSGGGIAYPSNYKGLPAAIVNGGGNTFKGNGRAVKDFFVDGVIGSFMSGTSYRPTLDSLKGEGSGGGKAPDTSYNDEDMKKIKTPYGEKEVKWLKQHINEVKGKNAYEFLSGEYPTIPERHQINSNLKKLQDSYRNIIYGYIEECRVAILNSSGNVKDGTIKSVDAMESIFRSGYAYYLIPEKDVMNGYITYEAMRLNNSEMMSQVNTAWAVVRFAYNEAMDNGGKVIDRVKMLADLKTRLSLGDYFNISISVERGIMLYYNEIPLGVSGDVADDLGGGTDASNLFDNLRDGLDIIYDNIGHIDDNENLREQWRNSIDFIMNKTFGDNGPGAIASLGGADAIIDDMLSPNPDKKKYNDVYETYKDAVKDTEDSTATVDTNVKLDGLAQLIKDKENNGELNQDEFGVGSSADDLKAVTVQYIQQLLHDVVAKVQANGSKTITYEKLLATLEGVDESDKLSKALVVITLEYTSNGGDKKAAINKWLATLNLKPFTGSGFDNLDMAQSAGYVMAMLDMRKGGEFIFDIKLSPEKEAEYLERLAITEDKNLSQARPSTKFIFGEYGLVLEPIVWMNPVSATPGNWESDGGKYASGAKGILYRCKYPVYGTPSNFAKWMEANPSKHYSNEYSHTSVWKVFGMCMFLDEVVPYFHNTLGNTVPLNMPADDISNKRLPAFRQNLKVSIEESKGGPNADFDKAFSYGWHFVGPNTTTAQNTTQVTWRKPEPSPGKAPDPSSLPDPSKAADGTDTGKPDKHFNIVKYYEVWDYTNDKENPEVTERHGPTIREQNPNIISIVDEPEYKVVDWFTNDSSANGLPPEDDNTQIYDLNRAEERVINSSGITDKVTATVTLGIDPDELGENTLNVLLIKKVGLPPPKTTGSGEIVIQQSQISKATHTASKNVGGANWGNYKFNFSIGSFQEIAIGFHEPGCYCPGHGSGDDTWHCGGCQCPGHEHSMLMPGPSGDNKLKFVFTGLHGANPIEVGKGKSPELAPKVYSSDGIHDKTLTSLGKAEFNFSMDGTMKNSADYVTVLWRHNDIPTLSTYKKADIEKYFGKNNWEVPATLIPNNQKIPAGKRVANGENTYNLLLDFGINQGLSDLDATASCSSGYDDCQHEDHQRVKEDPAWSYTYTASVRVKTYRGVKKTLAQEPFEGKEEKIVRNSTGLHFENTTIQDKQQVKFFPYIKMTFQTNSLQLLRLEESGSKASRFNTYVLSEQKSEILPSDAVEVGWINPTEEDSLNLISQQWSIHQRAVNGSNGWQGSNQVLPGGAIYQLNTGKSETNVKVVTYQTVVDQKTREYLSDTLTGDEYTEAKVIKDHKDFVNNAKDVLDNLRIVQWVRKTSDYSYDKSMKAWANNWDESAASSQVCVRGGGQKLTGLDTALTNTVTNKDEKYYMQKAGFGKIASEGDLDIIKEDQVTTVFKIFTDTSGNVYMAVTENPGEDVVSLTAKLKDINGDNMKGVKVLKVADKTIKWDKINETLVGDAKAIDDRTKIITNVVKSLERNTGADKTAAWASSDGKWYNEAFDGIYLVRQATTLNVGLKEPAKRTAALDPALCAPNVGQSDLYSKAYLSQFCMNDKSDAEVAKGKESRYLGTFKGVDIKLPEMQGLYQSRQFFIPNANVQDLK